MLEPKIRILHVLGCLDCGGAENLIMNVYRNIDKNKFEFNFLIHTDRECYFTNEVENLGGKIYNAPRYQGYNHIQYSMWFDRFFQKYKFDVIHGHMTSTACIYLKFAKKYGMVTVAHSHHTSSGVGIVGKAKEHVQLKAKKFADYRFACEKNAGKWLFAHDSFQVIKNGIQSEKYMFDNKVRIRIRNEFGLDDETMLYGHVGRFNTPKNHKFLLKIFHEIKKKNKNSKLMLVGDGNLKSDIQTQIRDLDIKDDVIFTGIRSDVHELLMGMDVFIFPSLYEGLGIVLIEAQATGTISFASTEVPKEANITGSVTYISLKDDAEKWAAEIVQSKVLVNREQYVKNIEDNGYNIINTVQELESFYVRARRRK